MPFKIFCDTREKNLHIVEELKKRNIEVEFKKLDFGDYSFFYNGVDYSEKIVFERKQSFNEIIGNLSGTGKRFYNEFYKARECRAKVILFIEEPLENLYEHKYRSKIKPYEFERKLNTFCQKFMLEKHFISRKDSTQFILSNIKKFLKKTF